MGEKLLLWKDTLTSLNSNDSLVNARRVSEDSISYAKSFVDNLSSIIAKLNVGNSGLNQSVIDADNAIVNSAGQQVTTANNYFQTADAVWSSARDSLTLESASSTVEDLQSGTSVLDKANAVVEGIENQIRQSYITAPFDGVVSSVNVKVGQVYVPGLSANEGIGLISNGDYKIEIFVPETDYGKITVGNSTDVTFDAYGPTVTFPAHISLIDPAETLTNGVKAYKITIGFDDPSDIRIKSGLTANVSIITKISKNALAVPSRAIIMHGMDTFILIKQSSSNSYVEQAVKTGIMTADGYTEIISGLNEGDEIAGFGLEK